MEEGDPSSGGGSEEAIQVYLRLKPSKRPSSNIKLAAGGHEQEVNVDGDGRRQLPQVRISIRD